ncbi:unnamed protein product [Gemmataceae bacterium]|nr:unnamed protein product [Gemmataceae bacterium]VTU00029.1 unnamed protein product [Gemmataceae bacterium]
MSNAAANAELIAGLTRLHGVVQQWLVADLTGPGRDPTRAYADMMFAFAFVRLGAAADAQRLRAAADAVLRADEEYASRPFEEGSDRDRWVTANTHRSGATMFGYRAEEALAGPLARSILPVGTIYRPPEDVGDIAPEKRVGYTTTQLRAHSRILEPAGFVDPYVQWTKEHSASAGEIARFHMTPEPDAGQLRKLVEVAEGGERGYQLRAWRTVLALAGTVDPQWLSVLLLKVSGVVTAHCAEAVAPTTEDTPGTLLQLRELLVQAVGQVATMPDGELFPPLVDAVVRTLTMIAGKGLLSQGTVLADLGWACLCWFQRLGDREAAEKFLYDTRDLWPETVEGATVHEVCAVAIRAGFLAFLRHEQATAAELDAVLGRLQGHQAAPRPQDRWQPKDVVQVATAYIRGAACGPVAGAVERVANLFPALPRIPNTWTTAQYFSRFHFVLVEALVLAFPAVRGA